MGCDGFLWGKPCVKDCRSRRGGTGDRWCKLEVEINLLFTLLKIITTKIPVM
jgi:hypothetical protein